MTALELGLIVLRLAALAASVVATCCFANHGVTGQPDAAFVYRGSEKNLAAARSAAKDWNTVCGTHLSVVTPPAPGDLPLTEVTAIPGGHGGETAYEGPFGRAVSVSFVDGPWTPAILRHEMGHVLGLSHDDSRPGVMNATVLNGEITPADCPGAQR